MQVKKPKLVTLYKRIFLVICTYIILNKSYKKWQDEGDSNFLLTIVDEQYGDDILIKHDQHLVPHLLTTEAPNTSSAYDENVQVMFLFPYPFQKKKKIEFNTKFKVLSHKLPFEH